MWLNKEYVSLCQDGMENSYCLWILLEVRSSLASYNPRGIQTEECCLAWGVVG